MKKNRIIAFGIIVSLCICMITGGCQYETNSSSATTVLESTTEQAATKQKEELDTTKSKDSSATTTKAAATTAGKTAKVATTNKKNSKGSLKVHYIDVGQGDCTLLQSGGKNVLIDAGGYGKGTYIQNYLQQNGVSTIDLLILTHPDADHIDSADVVITKFAIGKVWMPNLTNDTKAYDQVVQAIKYRSLKREQPDIGDTFSMKNVKLTVLGPVNDTDDANNSSIVVRADCGQQSLLFLGDAEIAEQQDILATGADLRADSIKFSHHGSYSGVNETFLNEVNAKYAIISCGTGNRYGHPHEEALSYIKSHQMKMFRTDDEGTIVESIVNGKVTYNVKPSTDYQSGDGDEKATSSKKTTKKSSSKANSSTANKKSANASNSSNSSQEYILNTNTKKIHKSTCPSVKRMKDSNKETTHESVEQLEQEGYSTCKNCF